MDNNFQQKQNKCLANLRGFENTYKITLHEGWTSAVSPMIHNPCSSPRTVAQACSISSGPALPSAVKLFTSPKFHMISIATTFILDPAPARKSLIFQHHSQGNNDPWEGP